jgi:hypothetical protein
MNGHEHDGRVWTRLMRRQPREARAAGGRGQNPPVRFWIITIMLVLVGLSTLKIR